jgi:hypothetical protein
VLVVLNLSDHDRPLVHITDGALTGNYTSLFKKGVKDFTSEKHFALGPWEYQVYVR